MKRVLIMAGGTGGHVIPALTVAAVFQEYGIDVHWLGTRNGIEAQLVPSQNIPIHYLNVQGIRGRGIKKILMAPFQISYALMQALIIMRQLKPNVVMGMGGFASGPGGIAAWILRKPLLVHEQNAVAGLTNRWLAKVASKVLQAFPGAFSAHYHPITTGNPIRAEIANLSLPAQRLAHHEGNLRLLVLGGSQGASCFNQVVPKTLQQMGDENRPKVWHIAGKREADTIKIIYQQMQIDARVDGFISNMAEAYTWADIVLCRAGALTISELAAAGVASILVPYPHAADDHQTRNGNYLVQANACVIVPQAEFTAEKLMNLIDEFQARREQILQMANNARSLRVENAAEKIVKLCLDSAQELS